MNVCRQIHSKLDWLIIGNGAELQLGHIFSHTLYGSRTRSRLTITRTGNPGRIVRVG